MILFALLVGPTAFLVLQEKRESEKARPSTRLEEINQKLDEVLSLLESRR